MKKWIALFCLFLVSSVLPSLGRAQSAAVSQAASDAGLDQVLAAIANVVKSQGQQEALDIIKDQIVDNLNGKTISYPVTTATKAVTTYILYIGSAPSSVTSDIYFQNTFNLLNGESLGLTDSYLLQTFAQDSLTFLLRLMLKDVPPNLINDYDLPAFAQFIYNSIQAMSQNNANAYSLATPLGTLASSLDSSNSNVLKSQTTALSLFRTVQSKLTTSKTFKMLMVPSKEAAANPHSLKLTVQSSPLSDPLGLSRLSVALKLISETLMAFQTASGPTNQFFTDLGNQVVALAQNLPGTAPLPQPLALTQSYNSPYVAQIQGSFSTLWGFLNADLQNASAEKIQEFASQVVNLVNVSATLPQAVNSNPFAVIGKLSDMMAGFSSIMAINNNSNAASLLSVISNILQDLSAKQWLTLITDITGAKADNGQPIVSGTLADALTFMRMMMEMYQAPSVADAQNILTANLETIQSRDTRYKSKAFMTLDVTSLLGVSYGATWVDNNEFQNRSQMTGLFVPVGIQFGLGVDTHPLGVMLYPFDLGSYVTGESSNIRLDDAFRSGVAVYFRCAIPVCVGIAADYKSTEPEGWRGLGFLSFEVPLFPLN